MGGGRGGDLAQDLLLQAVLRLPRHLPKPEGVGTSFRIRVAIDPSLERSEVWTIRYRPAEVPPDCGKHCYAISYSGELRETAQDKHPARPMTREAEGEVTGRLVLAGRGRAKRLLSHEWTIRWDRDIATLRHDGGIRGRLRQRVTSSGQLDLLEVRAAGLATDALDAPGEATDRYLSPAEVRAVLHDATDDFYTCFRTHLRGSEAPGETAVTFTIARSGRAEEVQPDLGRAPQALGPCLISLVEGLTFADHDGAPMEVSYPLVYQVDGQGARILPYPIVFTKTEPVRLPLLELPEDLQPAEIRLLEWIFTEPAPPLDRAAAPPPTAPEAAPPE
jgi:hypothetical protein